MATSSFLTREQTAWAREHFKKPGPESLGPAFSNWLGQKLLERLSHIEAWRESQPIALGSWARSELSPKSDIDLLFCGPEEAVKTFMKSAQAAGLKVRARVPEDPLDWTQGVGPFDVIALLMAKSFDEPTEQLLLAQQAAILQRSSQWKKSLIKEMNLERRERTKRYDSITHFLEPNLKYGPGGLRDIQQALVVFSLFPDRFEGQEKVYELLLKNRNFLLSVRQALHLLGGSEILSASEQLELSSQFEFEDVKLFAREVHLTLDRISFFSDWSLEQVRLTKKERDSYRIEAGQKLGPLIHDLSDKPCLSQQWKIRGQVRDLWAIERPDDKQRGKWIQKYLNLEASEEFFRALFRSRILEQWVPDLARVKGLVQHDHYHRYTLDTHIHQGLKLLNRVYKRPKMLGGLQFILKNFSEDDWRIMTLTALYHDLGKGLGGDHSNKGVELVQRDFAKFGYSDKLTKEVSWLVENHLILSTAAFRRNPLDPSTWRWLHERGVEGERLRKLALWTWVDIQATNPEAWTTWKARLMEDLVKALESEEADRFRGLLDMSRAKHLKLNREVLEKIDLGVLQSLPLTVLVKDLENATNSTTDLPLLVKRLSPHRTWVRFHRKQDRKGLFLEFVQSLYAAGCTILESTVRTLPEVGVYDWFLVKTSKSPAQLKKTVELISKNASTTPPAKAFSHLKFDHIQLIETSDTEMLLSFRGKDQRGLLLAAAQALYGEDLEILWAKVHTWGKQVDDVFGVRAGQKASEVIERLKENWQQNSHAEFDL